MSSQHRTLHLRGTAVGVLAAVAGLVVALGTAVPGARAADPVEPGARLDLREALVERVRRSGPRGERVVDFVRRRRAEVELRLVGDVPADDTLTSSTPVAMRVGGFVLESSLGADPRWRPGRRRALLHPLPGDPSTTIALRWTARRVRIELRTGSDVVLGDPGAETPDGPLGRTFDAAAAFGDASWFLRGSADGRIRRGELRLLDEVLPLRDARITGRGEFAPPTDDPVAPAVALAAPRQGFLSTEPVTQVTGEALDDRAVARVTWTLDGGAESEVAVAPDATVNPVRGQRVAFDFAVPVAAAGLHTLRISAYDLGGSVSTQEVAFAYVVPAAIPLSTGGGGASPALSAAVVGGELFTWGDDALAGLADGAAGPAVQEEPTGTGLTGVRDVAFGREHGLALLDDGRVLAWGRNTGGKLGDGSSTSTVRAAPVPVVGIDDAVAIAAGLDFSLALRADGTVWGWGWSGNRQLGTGLTELYSLVPVRIEGLSDAVAVSAGAFHSAALVADGTVRCWGSSLVPLGGTPSAPGAPVQPLLASGDPLDDVAEVRAGYWHIVARRGDGTVFVWGGSGEDIGALGLGAGVTRADLPTRIPSIDGAVSIAAALDCGFAVLGDGSVVAWGANAQGQLGDGTRSPRPTPAPVLAVTDAVSVHADGQSTHVLAQRRDNVVLGWGLYSFGAARPLPPPTTTPVVVPLPSPFDE